MNILNKLTIKNLKLNKKRTTVTVIGIILSVALITAVASIYTSAVSSLIDYETREKGNFHVAFFDVPSSEIKTLENNRQIENIYLTKDIGYAKLEESKNEYKPYAFIKGFTNEALENLSVKLVEGSFPKNESEIVIPTHLRTNGRVTLKVGDTITLDIGTRVSEGERLNQNSSYIEGIKEEIINTTSKTYKIVGIVERPASNIEAYDAPGYTFITYANEKEIEGNVSAYIRYTKTGAKDYLRVTANILGIDEDIYEKYYTTTKELSKEELSKFDEEIEKAKYQININRYLITLETDPLGESAIGGLGVAAGIVCVIIVFTSVFCIKNSFDISITEKIKQYGMLRSIGATKKQIRQNVFYEATILGGIGIPLGLLLGFLASFILVIISNHFISDLVAQGIKLNFVFSWLAMLVAIVLGVITIYLSATRSARKAARVSPIESIRNSAKIEVKAKKLKSPKIIKKIFGIGGEISYKNLKRNKRKYRTTTISIAISVLVFIALSSFMNLAFSSIQEELGMYDYNITISMSINDDEELYKEFLKATKLDNIEDYAIIRRVGCYINKPKYTEEYKKEYDIEEEKEDAYIAVIAIGEEQYNKYIKSLGLDYEKIKDKGILIDNEKIEHPDRTVNVKTFDYYTGDTIQGKITEEERDFTIEVGAVSEERPFSLKYYGTMIVVSDKLYEEKIKTNTRPTIYYYSNDADKLQDDIEELFKGEETSYYINNSAENVRVMENLYTLIGIFLYGFIIVISLIGITNIFNTITTNMELRKQEFAMLKSIRNDNTRI